MVIHGASNAARPHSPSEAWDSASTCRRMGADDRIWDIRLTQATADPASAEP